METCVKANDTLPLVVINQVHPIYVNSPYRQELRAVRGYMSSGPLAVEALPRLESTRGLRNAGVRRQRRDPSTGTIKLRRSSGTAKTRCGRASSST